MSETITMTERCRELTVQHGNDKGAIVVSLADYHQLWSEIPEELKAWRQVHTYGFKGITVANKIVIPCDEYEGAPRWASEEECQQWSR